MWKRGGEIIQLGLHEYARPRPDLSLVDVCSTNGIEKNGLDYEVLPDKLILNPSDVAVLSDLRRMTAQDGDREHASLFTQGVGLESSYFRGVKEHVDPEATRALLEEDGHVGLMHSHSEGLHFSEIDLFLFLTHTNSWIELAGLVGPERSTEYNWDEIARHSKKRKSQSDKMRVLGVVNSDFVAMLVKSAEFASAEMDTPITFYDSNVYRRYRTVEAETGTVVALTRRVDMIDKFLSRLAAELKFGYYFGKATADEPWLEKREIRSPWADFESDWEARVRKMKT